MIRQPQNVGREKQEKMRFLVHSGCLQNPFKNGIRTKKLVRDGKVTPLDMSALAPYSLVSCG
jgi:hypothetical protein